MPKKPTNHHVRIIGTDVSGKTALCDALEAASPDLVAFSETPKYVYRWLRTYRIGRSSSITPDQLERRESIFMRFNEHEAHAIDDVLEERTVLAVRGRADTLLTHAALRGRPMPCDFTSLFPLGMRPDLLVVLVAPPDTIEARLDARGERKTGANSMEFHIRCRQLYEEVGIIAGRHMPVLFFDTANPVNAPSQIGQAVHAALVSLD
jgi:thymidylate kinase